MEIPAELQERTDILFQELQSELGKHSANQFVLMRTAIHFEDNESSVINPQELMNTVGSEIGFTLELNDFKVALHLTDALVLLRLGMFEPLHHPCFPTL
jgi:hypothetical protein